MTTTSITELLSLNEWMNDDAQVDGRSEFYFLILIFFLIRLTTTNSKYKQTTKKNISKKIIYPRWLLNACVSWFKKKKLQWKLFFFFIDKKNVWMMNYQIIYECGNVGFYHLGGKIGGNIKNIGKNEVCLYFVCC